MGDDQTDDTGCERGNEDSINTRSRLKLQLAVDMASRASSAIAGREGGNSSLCLNISDPANDDLYKSALKRAEWLLSLEEELNLAANRVELYQFFDKEQLETGDDLAKILKDLNVSGLQSRASIKKFLEALFKELEKAERSPDPTRPNSWDQLPMEDIISRGLREFLDRLHRSTRFKFPGGGVDRIIQSVKESVVDNLQLAPSAEHNLEFDEIIVEHFTDYCLAKDPLDERARNERSSKATELYRPYPIFLCAAILQEKELLSTWDLTVPSGQPTTLPIRTDKVDLDASVGEGVLPQSLFPVFWERHPYWRAFERG